MKITFLDVETTGLLRDPRARVIELGFSTWEKGKPVHKQSTLIKSVESIPENISQINGITIEMLKDAPTFEEVWVTNKEYFQDALLVAHNLAFDVGMMNRELFRTERFPLGNMGIDTLPLSRKILPELSSYRLAEVARHFGIVNENPHRAMGDLETLEKILSKLLGSDPGIFDEGIMRLFCLWGGYSSHRYFKDVIQYALQNGKKIQVKGDFTKGLVQSPPLAMKPLETTAISLIGEVSDQRYDIPFDRIFAVEIEGGRSGEKWIDGE